MKRRNLLQIIGLAPIAAIVTTAVAKARVQWTGNVVLTNDILSLAINDRTAAYADLITQQNAFLDNLSKAGKIEA